MRVPPEPVKDFPSNDREPSARTERRINNRGDSVPFSGALSSAFICARMPSILFQNVQHLGKAVYGEVRHQVTAGILLPGGGLPGVVFLCPA